ncbi:MAG: hypothetical protein EOP00_21665 [Pedobacter sp.]|nr:MAG: hypothetical protein EOP00_21665 [Pedobacter sp.]
MPDDVDAFETPILYNLIQVSNSIGDIEKYKKLRKRFPEWANDLISDLFEDYPELMALKKHLESIGLTAFSTGTYDIIEKFVERKITSQIFDTRDDEIRAFFEPNYWKTLVDIIIRRIKSGFITEEKFYLIGFVFAEMESMYQDEIKKHLNSHYCAYSEGEFHFMTEDGSFHRWEIKIELNLMNNYFYNFEDFTPKLQI